MAGKVVWIGLDAPTVAQVSTHTVADTWATGDTATLTCGTFSVTFTVAGTETVAAVVAGLVAAWNDSTAAPLTEVTASDANPAVTLTADTAGIPFVTTASEDTAGNGTVGAQVDTTANSSPNDASVAANWDTGSVPGAGDDLVLENSDVSILYGLDFSGATLASFTRRSTYTGLIGLPHVNVTDAGSYVEYRDTHFKIDATLATIDASGSGRTNIDFGTVETACTINGSGTPAETGVPPVLLLGSNSSNVLIVNKGSVGVSFYTVEGETSELASATIGYITNRASDSTVVFGAGMAALTTVNINGGNTTILANVGTVLFKSGVAELGGTATVITALHVQAGTFFYKSSGTAATVNVYANARLDFSRDSRDRIVSNANVNLSEGGTIYDPAGTVTWTNEVVPVDPAGL